MAEPRRVGPQGLRVRDRQALEGVYHLVVFEAPAETLDEISRVLKIDDAVLRTWRPSTSRARERARGKRRGTNTSAPAARPAGGRNRSQRAGPAAVRPRTKTTRGRGGVMAANINRVILVGNLTRDPELRHTAGRHAGLQPRASREQPPARRVGPVGRQARTTSASRSSATRRELRAVPRRRAARRGRRPASTGASGRRRTAASARRSRSSPRPSSSSGEPRRRRGPARQPVRAAGPASESGADFPAAADDDIPF
jgi:single-stranded DNA-binding protein